MKDLNLWELMLSAGTNINCVPEKKRQEIQQMSLALSRMAYVAGQELSINVIEEGWLLKIFSVFDDTWEVNILISKAGKIDVSVGRIEEGRTFKAFNEN